jgi:N utilization substance protein B
MASPRRQARIIALQTLYEVDSTGHPVEDVLRRNLDEPTSENPNSLPLDDPAGRAFARSLAFGVLENADELDVLIEKSAPNWPIEQMSRIDKTILRLAIFEILFDNRVPLKAAINEAVELGKRFGSDSSSRFINGVLGTVASENQHRARKDGSKAGYAAETFEGADTNIPDGPISIDEAVENREGEQA